MRRFNRMTSTFFALLKAGLWEQDVRLLSYEPLDFDALYRLAEEQAVVGLLAAGLEHVEDRKVTKPEAIQFLKEVFSLETRNASMNSYIEKLVKRMTQAGVYALLIKGQGIAQCYERPLWRACGDIDLLLDSNNYEKAKKLFAGLTDSMRVEGFYSKHLGMSLDSWTIELHGTLRCGLSSRIDRALDVLHDETFKYGIARCWRNGDTDVFIPGADIDVIIIFTHILKHFYRGGIGLRQICDWCRFLWDNKNTLDKGLLEKRLRSMGLMSEWKAFSALAVSFIGMPLDAMPLYDSSPKWSRKATRIMSFILNVGNFGMKRDMSYFEKHSYLVRKTISLSRRIGDLIRHSMVFPLDSVIFFPAIFINGLRSAARGE